MANLSNGITPQELSSYPQNTLTGAEIVTITIGDFTYKTTLTELRKFNMPNKTELGLDKLNNTSDKDKPLSTAQINALALKSDTGHNHTIDNIAQLREILQSLLNIAADPSVEVAESEW